jgi:hypothetical protein
VPGATAQVSRRETTWIEAPYRVSSGIGQHEEKERNAVAISALIVAVQVQVGAVPAVFEVVGLVAVAVAVDSEEEAVGDDEFWTLFSRAAIWLCDAADVRLGKNRARFTGLRGVALEQVKERRTCG